MNFKVCERKWLLRSLWYCVGICLERLRKSTKKNQDRRRADRHLNFHRPNTKLQGTQPTMFRRIILHVTRMNLDRSGWGHCMLLGWKLDRTGSGHCMLLGWNLGSSGWGHCVLLGWNLGRSGSGNCMLLGWNLGRIGFGHCMLLGWNLDRSSSWQCPVADFDTSLGLNIQEFVPCRLVVIVPTFQRILQSTKTGTWKY